MIIGENDYWSGIHILFFYYIIKKKLKSCNNIDIFINKK